jgi:hypothetical protein
MVRKSDVFALVVDSILLGDAVGGGRLILDDESTFDIYLHSARVGDSVFEARAGGVGLCGSGL